MAVEPRQPELEDDDQDDEDIDLLEDDLDPDEPNDADSDETPEPGPDDADERPAERVEVRQPSKAQREIRKLRARAQAAERDAREAREMSARNSGQIDMLSRQSSGPSAADRQAEQERINAMSEREYADYKLGLERNTIAAAMQQDRFNLNDRLDKSDFRMACQTNKAFAAVAEQVETKLAEMRRQGQTAEREVIAKYLIGERAVQRALKGGDGRRERADTERARQTARPTRSGSDVAVERGERAGRKPQTAKERLEAAEAKGGNPFGNKYKGGKRIA